MAKLIKKFKNDLVPKRHCFFCRNHNERGVWRSTEEQAEDDAMLHMEDFPEPHNIGYVTEKTTIKLLGNN